MQAHKKLKHLLSVTTFDVLDECDELLSPKHQLVYAWGSQEPLPSLSERMHVLKAVLRALEDDRSVREMLDDRAVVAVLRHPQRYGAMPEVRLLTGATCAKHHYSTRDALPRTQTHPCWFCSRLEHR